jgi:hypothetical protein
LEPSIFISQGCPCTAKLNSDPTHAIPGPIVDSIYNLKRHSLQNDDVYLSSNDTNRFIF